MAQAGPLRELLDAPQPTGRVVWIGLSPERRGQITSVPEAVAEAGTGLDGDHHARSGKSKRQVTIVQAEHLPAIASFLDRDEIDPIALRRNLVVSGINLLGLKDRPFRIGDVLLDGAGPCAPCSRMNETLGPGGYHAVRGHGGICARVIEAGTIRVGDPVRPLEPSPSDEESE